MLQGVGQEAEEAMAFAAAGAALLATSAAPPPARPGPGADTERAEQLAAAAACLEQQTAAAAGELERQKERQEELRCEVDARCGEAEQQQERVAAALQALVARLACLSAPDAGGRQQHPPKLLSLDLPDSYATACQGLLDNLSGYLQQNFLPQQCGGGLAAAQQHQAAALELEQLQGCLVKAERLRVEEEAELARLQAELEVLRAPSDTAPPASLGYSSADLEAEVASLRRRQMASLQVAVQAAEAAAAAAAGAEVVEEQAEQRRAALEQRLHAKQQVASVLTRHLARQLLVRRLLQHEQAALQEAHAVVAAARQDAELALQAVQERLPGHAAEGEAGSQQQEQQQQQQMPTEALHPSKQQPEQVPSDPLAMAQQLLACRAQLQQLSDRLHGETLPAHRAVFAELYGLLYPAGSSGSSGSGSSDAEQGVSSGDEGKNKAGHCEAGAGSQEGISSGGGKGPELKGPELELTPAALREQLATVAAAEAAASLQANALLEEVIVRQRAPAERQLAEAVLHDFWARPERLAALAEKQQRQLATYSAA